MLAMSTQRDPTPIVRKGPTLRRLRELYRLDQVAEAEAMVEDVLRLFPRTDAAASALLMRGMQRRFRGDDPGALRDFEMAADSSTNKDARTAAFKAGSVAQILEDDATAKRMYLKVATKWPGTVLAAVSAGAVADLDQDRPDYWRKVRLDTIEALADRPVKGSRDDLWALLELVEHFWDDKAHPARSPAKAAAYARELLRRATARGEAEYARQADVALIAIETGRRTTAVEVLLTMGRDPRATARTLE